jgi:fatty acid desaturase
MTTNVGSIDRILRIAFGIAALLFAFFNPLGVTWAWVGYIGVVPLLTAAIGWCPAYTLLGLNTCPAKRAA